MDGLFEVAFAGQLLACFFMTGVIWIIQLIQYPGFIFSDREQFTNFHMFHSHRITFVVGPMMVLELLTAALLFAAHSQSSMVWATWTITGLNLASVVLLWALTFFISVPIHNKLTLGFDAGHVRKLTVTNWYRTALWSFRSALLLYFFVLGN